MASISSIEKDSIGTTRDSFKDCTLSCKISNQVYINFEKRKVPQAASDNFVKKWLFCKTFVKYFEQYLFLYRWPKFLKKTFEVVHAQNRSFSRKIYIHRDNLPNDYFYCSSFTSNFLNRYFLIARICSWWKKNQQTKFINKN